MTEWNAFKIFFDERSDLDRVLVQALRDWLRPWLALDYRSTRALCREIEAATGLDEARARRFIKRIE